MPLSPLSSGRALTALRDGVTALRRWMACRGLLPAQAVRLHAEGADAGVYLMPAGRRVERAGRVRHAAVALPPGSFVARRFELPWLPWSEWRDALRLAVEEASPFSADDTVWGWREVATDGTRRVAWLVITSRARAREALESAPALGDSVELWASTPEGHAVLEGIGSSQRERQARRALTAVLAAAGAVFALLAVLLLSPPAHDRLQVVQANIYLAALAERAEPVLRLRDELTALQQVQGQLQPLRGGATYLMPLVGAISATMPDDAWLESLDYSPGVLRISGRADNATALLAAFQERPEFNNVRSVSPITREARSGKDRFTFELEIAR